MVTVLPRSLRVSSRRAALRRLAGVLAILPFGSALVTMVRRSGSGRPPRQVRVAPAFKDGYAFGGEVVVHAGGDGRVTALSTRCTHLGCRISRAEDGLLVCPCHGSRFHADGRVATGPASHPLQTLTATVESPSGTIVVDV